MEPKLPLPGRDVILTCNAVRNTKYDELYIQAGGRGKCGQYLLKFDKNKCEKPTTTTCGIDPDILVSCGKSGTNTPYIKVTKRNLDPNDNGPWECFGTGTFPVFESVTITLGKYKWHLTTTHF